MTFAGSRPSWSGTITAVDSPERFLNHALEGRSKVAVIPRWPAYALALTLLCASAGCLGKNSTVSSNPNTKGPTSPTMLPLVYNEDGAVLFIGVDTRAGQYAKDGETMFPLGVALGNRSRRTLKLNRESFVVESSSGKRYPLVSVQEFNEHYQRSAHDRELAQPFLEALQVKFAPDKFRSRAFYPARSTTVVATAVDSFELGTTEWTHLYLYFPMPADGLHHRTFRLLVSPDGEPDPLVVGFEVR
jgi:hypothetical protein